MTDNPRQLEAQRLSLRAHLAKLDSDAVAEMLRRATPDVLGYAASGAGIARRVLLIEEASQELVEAFPLQDPTALEDARTVRASSIQAVEQIGQVLNLVCGWLEDPPAEPRRAEREVRSLLHAFSNVLVGINCYAELLTVEIQPGDDCHAALATINREGAAISRLVRERAALQRHLNELAQAAPERAPRLERQTLILLAGNLGVRVHVDAQSDLEINPSQVSRVLASLPPAEGQVLREALHRIGAPAA
jgi:hypothetical protein